MRKFLILFLILSAASLAACAPAAEVRVTFTPCPTSVSSSAAACPLPTRTPPPMPADALFQVLLPDGKSVAFTPIDIKQLPQTQVSVDGGVEPGLRLLDVLTAAGVTDFSEITFNGKTTLTLQKEQIDEQSALLTGSTTRLVVAGLPPEQQVTGVITIRVK